MAVHPASEKIEAFARLRSGLTDEDLANKAQHYLDVLAENGNNPTAAQYHSCGACYRLARYWEIRRILEQYEGIRTGVGLQSI